MRIFQLYRDRDVTGMSGTGVVADGFEFDDGTTVVRWRGEYPSTVVWDDIGTAEIVHGHGGATRLVFLGFDGLPLDEPSGPPERTARGFAHYLSAVDTYGKRVGVHWGPGVTPIGSFARPTVLVYADPGHPGQAAHLDGDTAVQVRDALNAWLGSIGHPATWRRPSVPAEP